MITDARVLQPEFVPREVEHRDQEVDALSSALGPIARGEPGETTFLFGPSGSGKTCIARFAVDRLRESVIDLEHQYVNCWQEYTRFRALYRLLEGIGRTVDVHRQSTPTDELFERLRRYDGPHYVVVLDEVDQLEDESVLYDLYRLRNVSMLLIANREDAFFSQLGDRLRSRLHSGVRVRFERYGLDELVSILADRVRWGLADGTVDEGPLATIADAAAGDAQVAIGILRNAARRAEREGRERITGETVRAAIPDGRAEVRRKTADSLPSHQRALYDVVTDRGEVDPGPLYDAYRERVEDPKSRRTVRNYLSKLAHYDLVVADGEKRGRTYRLPDDGA